MGRFGGYYKGEKKKGKKGLEKKPTFSGQGGTAAGWRLPEIIGARGKKSE